MDPLERAKLDYWTAPVSESEYYVTINGQSTSLYWNKASIWGQIFITVRQLRVLLMRGALSDERTGLSLAQSFSGGSPVGLVTIFYCLTFEASFFVTSYDSQGYGGRIRPRLHTEEQPLSDSHSYLTRLIRLDTTRKYTIKIVIDYEVARN
jgi:hypothetical protein